MRLEASVLGTGKLIIEQPEAGPVALQKDTLRGYRDKAGIFSWTIDSGGRRKLNKSVQKIVEGIQELMADSANGKRGVNGPH